MNANVAAASAYRRRHHRLNAVWHGSQGSQGSEGVQPGQRPNWWLQPVSDGEIARMMMTEQTVFSSHHQYLAGRHSERQ